MKWKGRCVATRTDEVLISTAAFSRAALGASAEGAGAVARRLRRGHGAAAGAARAGHEDSRQHEGGADMNRLHRSPWYAKRRATGVHRRLPPEGARRSLPLRETLERERAPAYGSVTRPPRRAVPPACAGAGAAPARRRRRPRAIPR